MNFLIFTLLFISLNARSQVLTEIDCSNGDCSTTNATVAQTAGDATYTALWINSILGDLRFFTPQGNQPRDSKIYLENRNANRNLNINLTSKVPNANGGSIDLVSDIYNIIQVNSSGNFGKDGIDSSKLCAQAFKAGDFGADGISYWNSRISLDDTRCLSQDMLYLDQKFSCPAGYVENSSGDVNVSRIEKKRKCVSLYNRSQCIQRTYDFTCKLAVVRKVCGDQTFGISDHGDYYIPPNPLITFNSSECLGLPSGLKTSGESMLVTFRITEQKKNAFATDELLCADLVNGRPKFTAYYNYTWDNNGIMQTDHVQNKTITFDDGANKTAFHWPLPDYAIDSRGDIINQTEMRFVLKSWIPTGFKDSAVESNNGYRLIKNCLGLNGSAANDFICDRVSGQAFTITANLIDKYGALSQDLAITIPMGRVRNFWYTWIGDSNAFYYGSPSGYFPACPANYKTTTAPFSGRVGCTLKYTPWGWPGIIAVQSCGGNPLVCSYIGNQLVSIKTSTLLGAAWSSGYTWGAPSGGGNHGYVALSTAQAYELKVKDWPLISEKTIPGYEFSTFAASYEVWTTSSAQGWEYY